MLRFWWGVCLVFVLLVCCGGCSEKQVPLKGERKNIFFTEQDDEKKENLPKRGLRLGESHPLKAWPLVHLSHENVVPRARLAGDLKNFQHLWSFSEGRSGDAWALMPPCVVKGHVFFINGIGRLICLDGKTGKKLWSNQLPFPQEKGGAFGGGVAFSRGRVYATLPSGVLGCWQAREGKPLWQINTQNTWRGAPLVYQKKIWAMALENILDARETQTGETVWRHSGMPENLTFLGASIPAVLDHHVFVCYSSGEIYCLNNLTGRPLWSFTVVPKAGLTDLDKIAHVVASPVVYRGHVYVATSCEKMLALNAQTGNLVWEKPFGGFETPLASGSELFVVTSRDLRRLDRMTGKTFWKQDLKELRDKPSDKTEKDYLAFYGPLLLGDTLYVLSEKGKLWAFDAASGRVKGCVLNLNKPCALRPIFSDGLLYILARDGSLHAFLPLL